MLRTYKKSLDKQYCVIFRVVSRGTISEGCRVPRQPSAVESNRFAVPGISTFNRAGDEGCPVYPPIEGTEGVGSVGRLAGLLNVSPALLETVSQHSVPLDMTATWMSERDGLTARASIES